MGLDTTIVAVSSSRGNSSRVLIRASGKNVFEGVQHIGVETKRVRLRFQKVHSRFCRWRTLLLLLMRDKTP